METLKKLFLLQQEKKNLAAQVKKNKDEIEALERILPEGLSASEDGQFVVDVRPRVMFDAATAKKNLSDELYKSICELKPTSKLAKEMLTGYEYKICQRITGVNATVKRAVDLG